MGLCGHDGSDTDETGISASSIAAPSAPRSIGRRLRQCSTLMPLEPPPLPLTGIGTVTTTVGTTTIERVSRNWPLPWRRRDAGQNGQMRWRCHCRQRSARPIGASLALRGRRADRQADATFGAGQASGPRGIALRRVSDRASVYRVLGETGVHVHHPIAGSQGERLASASNELQDAG